jgi:hypothetical protein
MNKSFFTISLDLELFWGVRDVYSIKSYGNNILGGRRVIPKLLSLFHLHGIHATWATVGLVTFSSKKELIQFLPSILPGYNNPLLNPYNDLKNIGKNEQEDPYHFGYSLVRKIQEYDNMEIASHTFGHFNCLEKRKNEGAFRSDLASSVSSLNRLDIFPETLVFCRNQYDEKHLKDAISSGFKVFRGNENNFIYRPRSIEKESLFTRGLRLADSYINLTGSNVSHVSLNQSGLINVSSSRFLRPVGLSILEQLRLKRILSSMESAAKKGVGFHLWWHPHNFGVNQDKNIAVLEKVLIHFRMLQDKFGMQSLTMEEASKYV